jgi:hypothetical protein
MTRIALLSDTHGWLDAKILSLQSHCDEWWHAGDLGSMDIARTLSDLRPLKAVYGNIDDQEIREAFPERMVFTCEKMVVCMVHIGGYPSRYAPGIKQWLKEKQADLFICGHSHILKIQYDTSLPCMHINPGACGRQGWHSVRTVVQLTIHEKELLKAEIIELGSRGG